MYSKTVLLINSGAEVNIVDSKGQTALILAVKYNYTNILELGELLIDAGADIDQKNIFGQSAAMIAQKKFLIY
jgi:ankyrin repeat protein